MSVIVFKWNALIILICFFFGCSFVVLKFKSPTSIAPFYLQTDDDIFDTLFNYILDFEYANNLSEMDDSKMDKVSDLLNHTFTYDNLQSDFACKSDCDVIKLIDLVSLCVNAAKAGGMVVREARQLIDRKMIDDPIYFNYYKNIDNAVQRASLFSHLAMRGIIEKTIKKKFITPAHDEDRSAFSEQLQETKDILLPVKDIVIWFDSLDGKKEFMGEHLKFVTTMMCVAVNGKPLIGVIYQPFEDYAAYGVVGEGAFLIGLDASSEQNEASRPLRIVMTPVFTNEEAIKGNVWQLFGAEAEVIPIRAAGYKILQVLLGKADAYIHNTSINKWKICAGHALLASKNATMTSLNYSSIEFGNAIDVTHKEGVVATHLNASLFGILTRVMPDFYFDYYFDKPAYDVYFS